MFNIFFKRAFAHQSIAFVFFTSGLVSGLLVSCNPTSDRVRDASTQKLAGTWEFKNSDGGKIGTAIFETQNDIDGNVYIFSNDLSSGKIAIAGKFKANPHTNPQQLDFVFGDLTTQTIYEVDRNGLLKIANAVPDRVRPDDLGWQPQQLTKISDRMTIDSDIKILKSADLASSTAAIRENEGKASIRAILRSQQQIFQEKGQFSTDINQIKSGLQLSSDLYTYKVNLFTEGSELMLQHSAIPVKDGLKAYTGIIYTISGENGQKATRLIMCESNLTTKAIASKPQNQDEGYRCPDNYTFIDP